MQAFNLSAESTEIMLHVCTLCVSAVAEKTTGAMGNIVAATGLGKKDEFPTDMNVRAPLQPPSAPCCHTQWRFSFFTVFTHTYRKIRQPVTVKSHYKRSTVLSWKAQADNKYVTCFKALFNYIFNEYIHLGLQPPMLPYYRVICELPNCDCVVHKNLF